MEEILVKKFFGTNLYGLDYNTTTELYKEYFEKNKCSLGLKCNAVDSGIMEIKKRDIVKRPGFNMPVNRVVVLNLSERDLKEFLKAITKFDALECLDLSNNEIPSIREEISLLQVLRRVDLSYNKLDNLPSGIEISPMWDLNLRGNNFSELPECLIMMGYLNSLDVRENPIRDNDPVLEELISMGCEILYDS